MFDPIADLCARIKNGQVAQHATIQVPFSKNILAILQVLRLEGFIVDAKVVPVESKVVKHTLPIMRPRISDSQKYINKIVDFFKDCEKKREEGDDAKFIKIKGRYFRGQESVPKVYRRMVRGRKKARRMFFLDQCKGKFATLPQKPTAKSKRAKKTQEKPRRPLVDPLRIRQLRLGYHFKLRQLLARKPSSPGQQKMQILVVLKYQKNSFVNSDLKKNNISRSIKKAGSIKEIVRISKPGYRVYRSPKELPPMRTRQSKGIYILSTSQGVLSDIDAAKLNIGGEVLCFVC